MRRPLDARIPRFMMLLAGLMLLVAGAVLTPAHSATADVDDFEFSSMEVDYHLGIDGEGHATLRTVETLVAEFPPGQNRGIRRAIPMEYNRGPTDVRVVSVTDENGAARPFTVEVDDETDDGYVVVTSAVPVGSFAEGSQTYVIEYEQRDVVRHFDDTAVQEFYWDVNGTGWPQPFGSVVARVHVADPIAGSLTGRFACYRGAEGSTDPCPIAAVDGASETVVEATASGVGPFETMTVAIAFEPDTFVVRDNSYFASPWAVAQAIVAVLLLGLLVALIGIRVSRLRDAEGRGTIVPEYEAPGMEVLVAAVLLHKSSRAVAAQLVDLAVRGRIRILESTEAKLLGSRETFTLELVDPAALDDREERLLRIMFGGLQPGARHRLSKSDSSRGQRVYKLMQSVRRHVVASGLRRRPPLALTIWPLIAATALAALAFVFGILVYEDGRGSWEPAAVWALAAVVEVLAIANVSARPLTEKGVAVRDHVRGVELFIRVAEADRIRVLQSPSGAERRSVAGVDTNDRVQMLKLYERLLPYAVLFKLEREWAERIGPYYDESGPGWYSGRSGFHAGVFAGSISTMSSAVSSSYSGSSSSSSSGGSSGGGSAGGGGGGGGGGGV